MNHARGLNKRGKRTAHRAEEAREKHRRELEESLEAGVNDDDLDIEGRAPIPVGCIGNLFNPGWETDCAALETVRLCPGGYSYHTDMEHCFKGCWWPAQVPDDVDFPDWLQDCGNVWKDWQRLCFVPD